MKQTTSIKQPESFFEDQFMALDFEADDRPSSSSPDGANVNRDREAPWPVQGRAQTQGIWHQTRHGFFLCGLRDERKPFCILMAAETNDGKLATAIGSSDGPPVMRTG
jgi:hypothetical protein